MIKYLGSKRRLVPVLGAIAEAVGAHTALDLFTGTTRVAQELKRRGTWVTAVDSATYAHLFARCYVELDGAAVDRPALAAALAELNGLPGEPGYFTETFCVRARYLHPRNGARVDAIRHRLADRWAGSPLFPVLLTSLVEAADRVDSTTGLQMAYLKAWAPRAHNDLELLVPPLLPGAGRAVLGDAVELAGRLGSYDLAYLDPPYNQHRYFTNYHVWETLVRGDEPEVYGVACKRVDSRDEATKSVFNRRRAMPAALRRVVEEVDCRLLVLSYNDEAWVSLDELREMCAVRGSVEVLAFDSKRYVGAQIGIHNPAGERVGTVSHLRNQEYVLVAGEAADVARAVAPVAVAVPLG
ncbi:MAG TPA: DNA adenine methylase [Acidimicrobiales bacterium]|nr:DNA adenine methylase [Acidimicrobiales bacterium]